MEKITAKIDATVKKFDMLHVNDYIVVGVSGGADSMLLLNYLILKKEEYNLKLVVANVEHGIRGQESIDDSKFVEDFCKEQNVDCSILRIDAINDSKTLGKSVEEYSREKRYDFFKSFNADKIATAHNLSDNVETVLFRLSRGTSIKGCCGIPAIRENIIRPLIECSSDEIRDYCNDNNVPFVIDSTNLENDYSRNYIRNVMIPNFENLNSSFEKVFSRFINSVNEDEDFIEKMSDECFDICFKNNCLSLNKLRLYHTSVIKRTIVRYYSLYNITLDENHLNETLKLVYKPGRCQIKGNNFAISDKKRLRLAIFEEKLCIDDIFINKKVISRSEFLTNCKLLQKQFDFYCDYDKIYGNVTIRTRIEGDIISPAGRDCSKSLKKLYNELQIPIEDREYIPVIIDEKGVIGVYGYCCDERVKIDNTTNNVILINIQEDNG